MSYREKALREAAEAKDDTTRFAAASHAREAQRLIPGIRDEVSREAERTGEALQNALATQQRLYADAAAGTVTPAKANRINRRLTAVIESLRSQLAGYNACLQVQSSDALGGFADMPLAAYERGIRKTPPRIPVKPTAAGFVLWIALVAISVLGSLYYLDYFKIVTPVALEISRAESESDTIRITCRNDSQSPILLYVPWHSPVGDETDHNGSLKKYGLAVYVRERNSRQFRHFPITVDAWSYQGRNLRESTPIEVAPHLYVNIVLEEKEALAGADPDALRIVLLDADGAQIAQHQINIK